MKATFSKKSLLEALKKVSPCCGSTRFSILENALLCVHDGGATITGTDLSTAARVNIDAENATEDGTILLDVKRVIALLSTQAADAVTIWTNKNSIKIDADGFSSTTPAVDVMEYPPVKIPDAAGGVAVGGAAFRAAIKKALVCVSQDQSRKEFTGVWMALGAGGLTLVSTDGYRLAMCTAAANGECDALKKGVIVDAAGLRAVLRCDAESLQIAIADNKIIIVSYNGGVISASTINGQFPDFSKVIPNEPACALHINRADLANALKTISLFSSKKSNSISLEPAENGLYIRSETESGRAEQIVSGEKDGQFLRLGLSWKFLLDAVNACDDGVISLYITDADTPVKVCGENPNDYTFIVMAMQF